jgi:hypothetical protein
VGTRPQRTSKPAPRSPLQVALDLALHRRRRNIEEHNASPAELVEIAKAIALRPGSPQTLLRPRFPGIVGGDRGAPWTTGGRLSCGRCTG